MIVKKMGKGLKIGPVFVARHSLGVSACGYGLGVAGRSTLSGDFIGWSLYLKGQPLNRSLSMDVDKPRVTRWHW